MDLARLPSLTALRAFALLAREAYATYRAFYAGQSGLAQAYFREWYWPNLRTWSKTRTTVTASPS